MLYFIAREHEFFVCMSFLYMEWGKKLILFLFQIILNGDIKTIYNRKTLY